MRSIKNYNESAAENFVTEIMKTAANTFSKVAGFDMVLRSVKFEITTESQRNISTQKKDARLHVLVTPLLGEIAGRSYLVMSENEVDQLLKRSPFQPANGYDQVMKEAMLKEIDNIVSASVVGELANRFRIDLYGDVPELHVLSVNDLTERVDRYIPNGQLSFLCKGNFEAKDDKNFAPEFIWKFSAAIVNQIETVVI